MALYSAVGQMQLPAYGIQVGSLGGIRTGVFNVAHSSLLTDDALTALGKTEDAGIQVVYGGVLGNVTKTIDTSSAATPTVITTTTAHGLANGASIDIRGHSVTALNGLTHYAKVLTTTTFELYSDAALTVGRASTGGTGGTVRIRQILAREGVDVAIATGVGDHTTWNVLSGGAFANVHNSPGYIGQQNGVVSHPSVTGGGVADVLAGVRAIAPTITSGTATTGYGIIAEGSIGPTTFAGVKTDFVAGQEYGIYVSGGATAGIWNDGAYVTPNVIGVQSNGLTYWGSALQYYMSYVSASSRFEMTGPAGSVLRFADASTDLLLNTIVTINAYDDYDDVEALEQALSSKRSTQLILRDGWAIPEYLSHLVDMGVCSIQDDGEVFMSAQRFMSLLAGGIYQTKKWATDEIAELRQQITQLQLQAGAAA